MPVLVRAPLLQMLFNSRICLWKEASRGGTLEMLWYPSSPPVSINLSSRADVLTFRASERIFQGPAQYKITTTVALKPIGAMTALQTVFSALGSYTCHLDACPDKLSCSATPNFSTRWFMTAFHIGMPSSTPAYRGTEAMLTYVSIDTAACLERLQRYMLDSRRAQVVLHSPSCSP